MPCRAMDMVAAMVAAMVGAIGAIQAMPCAVPALALRYGPCQPRLDNRCAGQPGGCNAAHLRAAATQGVVMMPALMPAAVWLPSWGHAEPKWCPSEPR